ncbi:hypothetical protein RIF23_01915 [Lipingzhangella sp. LS1_29]|uniref:Uncharacterized protein n=1 Tax=Lipingzhangella rawalii TaxID=2055835 RepID=A0ABU2H162_9ACTN|nr:hypothetical protein [Lipingzhangella rawalii]MDS1269046.1 hypothetical protein [Lipingzhangella rawalii]
MNAEARSGESLRPGDEKTLRGASTGELVVAVAASDEQNRKTQRRALGRLAVGLAARARAAGVTSVAGGRWLADVFTEDVVPRLPIRDAHTLSLHYPDLNIEERAQALIRTASATTTTVGAAGGAAAAVKTTAPPLLLTSPALLTAETLAVATVEVKLLAELHENYGFPARGGTLQRTSAYVASWVHRRGLDHLDEDPFGATVSVAARTALRNRLMKLLGRHLSTFGPYLTGAVAGGAINRASTRKLAEVVCTDLRGLQDSTTGVDIGGTRLPCG